MPKEMEEFAFGVKVEGCDFDGGEIWLVAVETPEALTDAVYEYAVCMGVPEWEPDGREVPVIHRASCPSVRLANHHWDAVDDDCACDELPLERVRALYPAKFGLSNIPGGSPQMQTSS